MKSNVKLSIRRAFAALLLFLAIFVLPAGAEEGENKTEVAAPPAVVAVEETQNKAESVDSTEAPAVETNDVKAETAASSSKIAEEKSEKAEKKAPAPSASVTLGVFGEANTNRYDYTMMYTLIKYKDISFRFDYFDRDSMKRYWLNIGNFPVIKGDNFQVDLSPALAAKRGGLYYYGSDVKIRAPKLGLSIHQKHFAGNKGDMHYTFADQKFCSFAAIHYYRLVKTNYVPDSYLGPKIYIGKNMTLWYGFSTNRPNASAIHMTGNFSF